MLSLSKTLIWKCRVRVQKLNFYVINSHPEFVSCLSSRISPEPLDRWSYERFLRIFWKIGKKSRNPRFFLFFFKNVRLQIFSPTIFFFSKYFFDFLYYFALGGSERSERWGGCRRAKRAARRRPRCRSRRLRQQRVNKKKKKCTKLEKWKNCQNWKNDRCRLCTF